MDIVCRAKLHKLFCLIEKEFETLYLENVSLQEKLDTLTEKVDRESLGLSHYGETDAVDGMGPGEKKVSSTSAKDKVFSGSGRLKSRTDKLRYQTTKIMSGLKAAQSAFSVNPVKRYSEHKDGVWEVRHEAGLKSVETLSLVCSGVCQQTRAACAGHGQR